MKKIFICEFSCQVISDNSITTEYNPDSRRGSELYNIHRDK